VRFAAMTLYIVSQRVFIVVVYFVFDPVRKLLDTPSYTVLRRKRDEKLGGRPVYVDRHLLTFVEGMCFRDIANLFLQQWQNFFDMKKTQDMNYFLRLTLMKLAHLTVTKTLIPIWTLTLTEDMKKTAAASGSKLLIWSRSQGTWNSVGVHLNVPVD
jgi:hypothetical protein